MKFSKIKLIIVNFFASISLTDTPVLVLSILSVVRLNAVMLSVEMVSIAMKNIVLLSGILLYAFLICVFILNATLLNTFNGDFFLYHFVKVLKPGWI